MGQECNYSFSDLFAAAHGRQLNHEETAAFAGLSQAARNEKVKELAAQAGWRVEERMGTDGQVYAAFWPVS